MCGRLHKTQDLLYDSTKDFLEQRYQGRADERSWMGEKDKLLQQLDRCKSQLSAGTHNRNNNLNVSVTSHDGRTASAEELKVAVNLCFGDHCQMAHLLGRGIVLCLVKVGGWGV